MESLTKGREVKPLLLKLSIFFAFSLTGFLLSQFRSWRICPALKEESHDKNDEDLEKIKKENHASPTATNPSVGTGINNNTTEPSTVKRCQPKEALSNLPDKNHKSVSEILRENTQDTLKDKVFTSVGDQILQLTNMIVSFQERERGLEQQLSRYQGMRDQENTIRELESKLKIYKVEMMIYNTKIETLKMENQRLQAYEEDAKVKIKTLKNKLKEVEEESGILAGLHRKVSILHEDKLRKLIDQENKCMTLQKKNSELLSENSDLLKKLELAQQKNLEAAEELKELECSKLTNEELRKDIEVLKLNSSKDNEELVYLRWVNACLRYELRNFNPSSGKTAKDLANKLSQESKGKAKSLILEYASSISEIDQEDPCLSEDGGATSKPTTPSSETGRKKNHSKGPEFFNKLAKFMLRKKSHNFEEFDGSDEMRRASTSSSCLEEILSSRGSSKKSSSSGSNTTPSEEVDIIDAIKRKKIENLTAQKRALECEKADLRSFANKLNRSKALQFNCKKSSSMTN